MNLVIKINKTSRRLSVISQLCREQCFLKGTDAVSLPLPSHNANPGREFLASNRFKLMSWDMPEVPIQLLYAEGRLFVRGRIWGADNVQCRIPDCDLNKFINGLSFAVDEYNGEPGGLVIED